MSWKVQVQQELDGLKAQGLLRHLREVSGAQGPEITLQGRRVANFSSNNYLGLAASPMFRDAVLAAMTHLGTGASASRLIVGNLSCHRELEHELAAWKGTEAALLFASGYQANVGIVSALAGPGDLILSDELNHASLIDGCRLSRAAVGVYRHLDYEHLEALLSSKASLHRRTLLVSDSVFSMDGDQAGVQRLTDLAGRYGAISLLDEAHAAGVLGTRGTGLSHGHPVDLQVGTLGKAFGVAGAYVCCSRLLRDYLLNRCRAFIYSTAPDVPTCAASRAALSLVSSPAGEELRRRLRENMQAFQEGLAQRGIVTRASHIVPIRVRGGEVRRTMELSERLLERGIFAQGIRPPTVPEGTARLRFALMASHTSEQIAAAVDALGAFRDLLADAEAGEDALDHVRRDVLSGDLP